MIHDELVNHLLKEGRYAESSELVNLLHRVRELQTRIVVAYSPSRGRGGLGEAADSYEVGKIVLEGRKISIVHHPVVALVAYYSETIVPRQLANRLYFTAEQYSSGGVVRGDGFSLLGLSSRYLLAWRVSV